MADEKPSITAPNSPISETNWQFSASDQSSAEDSSPQSATQKAKAAIKWSASEFIAHDKSFGWYALLAISTIIAAGLTYLVTHGDRVSTGMIIIAAVAFGIFAARKPRELDYSVDTQGIKIGEKFYPYGDFRSFAIVQEEAVESIWFMPLKRFMPPLTIYFDPKDGHKIVDTLAEYLPLEDKSLDIVDRLMHRLRF